MAAKRDRWVASVGKDGRRKKRERERKRKRYKGSDPCTVKDLVLKLGTGLTLLGERGNKGELKLLFFLGP
jgi:hypothetical protein